MKVLKKIGPPLLWLGLLAVLITGIVIATKNQNANPVIGLEIKLDTTLSFITKNNVKEIITNKGYISGKSIEEVNLREIELNFLNNPYIETAQISKTLKGHLTLNIKQRNPIARVYTSPSKSYYIDDKGKPMPTSKQFTKRTLMVTGFTQNLVIHNPSLITQAGLEKNKKHNDLYLKLLKLLDHIYRDSFWNAQISQIEINEDKTITMTTLAGNQQILFGKIAQIHSKFEKLLILYKEGFSNTGWQPYSTIDLRFKDQIVCKKTTYDHRAN